MATTLRELMGIERFRMRLVTGCEEADAVLDEPLAWAHSSDLLDPTPWLEEGQLLLTDGSNFVREMAPDAYPAYVRRMKGKGIRAIGFATDVVHASIPAALVAECRTQAVPLLEVRDGAPFMGIIRHVSDAVAAEREARLSWSHEAQRAIARAALRPAGVGAILAELERQLGCWVALFDSTGRRVGVPTRIEMPAGVHRQVEAEVARALERGVRSAMRIDAGDGAGATVQTMGMRGALRGALAVGISPRTVDVESALVDSVIALASIAFEQSHALDDAHRDLRAGVLQLILAGEVGAARRAVRRSSGALPPDPIRAIVLSGGTRGRALVDELEVAMRAHRGRVFFAEHGGSLVIIVAADDLGIVRPLIQAANAHAGASAPSTWTRLSEALEEARNAGDRGAAGITLFDDVAERGMAGLFTAGAARDVARRVLEPLARTDTGTALLADAEAWLRHNGAWDPAARERGIHRHTLRSRIEAVGQGLGMDLASFDARAELWWALKASGAQGASTSGASALRSSAVRSSA